MQIGEVLSNGTRELQQFRIGFPIGPRAIFEGNSKCCGRFSCDGRLEKDVSRRRCNEAKDRDDRPCQNPRLPAGKLGHRFAPVGKSAASSFCLVLTPWFTGGRLWRQRHVTACLRFTRMGSLPAKVDFYPTASFPPIIFGAPQPMSIASSKAHILGNYQFKPDQI